MRVLSHPAFFIRVLGAFSYYVIRHAEAVARPLPYHFRIIISSVLHGFRSCCRVSVGTFHLVTNRPSSLRFFIGNSVFLHILFE